MLSAMYNYTLLALRISAFSWLHGVRMLSDTDLEV